MTAAQLIKHLEGFCRDANKDPKDVNVVILEPVYIEDNNTWWGRDYEPKNIEIETQGGHSFPFEILLKGC